MSKVEAEIREVLADFERGMRECDAAGVTAHYAPGVVKYTLAPPLAHGADEVLDPANLQAWFDGHGGDLDYAITELEVTAGDEVAFARSINRMGSTHSGFTLWFRASYGLRKVDGAWLIAHEHTSTPFYMDGSLRAAVDLTPSA